MTILFIELAIPDAHRHLTALSHTLRQTPHCQRQRLLKNTVQKGLYLLETEWSAPPGRLALPEDARVWSFEEVADA